ncbi:transcription factor Ouib-like isoform X2 [Lucilia sericata]|uniref:transcription factor Ouib-like isoform X2 n=1 Tax=Lucilia sericata TaxID=13632 RepID=UPI0018A7F81B|nr:transcription factor Ouib-like isoform X2 [Lucilia sericata]
MCEDQCRICAKTVQEKDATNLFDIQNKNILLQLKDLTGVRVKRSRGYRKPTSEVLIEATEFVQVFAVKEERNIVIDKHEVISSADEEKEINIESQDLNKRQILTFAKGSRDEINALELKPNEENTLEDTKILIEEVICEKLDENFDTSKPVSDEEALYINDSDVDYNPETAECPVKKPKTNRKGKKAERLLGEGQNTKIKKEITKSRKKRKDAYEHPNIFICDQCGNHFTCRHHFKLHLRRHSGDKRCACELCPDKFFTSSELRRHMRRHTGERPFACKFCDRRFTDYSTRIKHERTHTNERPFMCSQCGKSFTTSYILKNHMLTHTGERLFKCDVCNRSFTRRTHLVVHFRSIMHKQAVEKDKRPTSQEELTQSRCLIPQSTNVSTFLV